MATVNARRRTIRVKIVYYGAGLCGKTTNLANLHARFSEQQRGALVKLDTETERTLFFDYFPAHAGTVGGYKIQVDLFTVPGQSFYNETRRTILQNVDGIVFVADSTPTREQANLVAYENMIENLATYGRSIDQVPLVFQWNKRDVPRALPTRLFEKSMNPKGLPSFEAVAVRGEGVWETQTAVVTEVLQALRRNAREARAHA
jgi:signal recognition particle receptor subunit beta